MGEEHHLRVLQMGEPRQNRAGIRRGLFDQRTLEIVLSFQQAYNAQNPGAPLLEVDPTDPNAVIDATTVALIMNAEVPMG